MIATVHIAEVSRSTGMRLLRTRLDPKEVQGLRYARVTMLAPLSSHLLPKPSLGRRVGLIAGWEDDLAVEEFLADHPLAAQLAEGWQVRLQPTRIFGAWPPLPDLLDQERPMDEGEPAAVLTIGRLRNSQGPRFLRASAAAEGLALRDPGLLASTGMARPPEFVATFSLWRTVGAMRAYALRALSALRLEGPVGRGGSPRGLGLHGNPSRGGDPGHLGGQRLTDCIPDSS
jgi:hypothetical protein